jgi:hypothetical protein
MPDPPLCAAPIPLLVPDDPILTPNPGGNIPGELEFGVIPILLLLPPRYPGDTRGGVGASMMDPNCGCGEVVLGTGDKMEDVLLTKGTLGCGENMVLTLDCEAYEVNKLARSSAGAPCDEDCELSSRLMRDGSFRASSVGMGLADTL